MKRKNGPGETVRFDVRKSIPYDAESEKARNIIGCRIAEARKKTGMSLVAFSHYLKDYGVVVGDRALNKWETGTTIPNAYQLMALCAAMDIEDGFRYFAGDYRASMNETGMRKVEEYKADLIASGRYRPEPEARNNIVYIDMRVSNLAASAGTGSFLDDDNFETVSFPESSVPAGADFGIRVSGDSMEPVYHDGQIVWVQQCDRVGVGEVGIFMCDGEGFIKAYGEQEPSEELTEAFTDSYGVTHQQPVLISYNKAYEPRVISPMTRFQTVGRVL